MQKKIKARIILAATTIILIIIAIIIKIVNENLQLNVIVSSIVAIMCIPNMIFAKEMQDKKSLKIYMFCFVVWAVITLIEIWKLLV